MPVEHEAKFAVADCLAVAGRLRHIGTCLAPWHFESNLVFDKGAELRASGRLLRLRTGQHHVLTFKEPLASPDGVKSRRETECVLQDPEAMTAILAGLGYVPCLRYEKFRTVWAMPVGQVFLDILPFGHFVEIEAVPDAIAQVAVAVGLDPAAALALSYHDVNREWRTRSGLAPDDSFVFSDLDRNLLFNRLGCRAHP